ncbi:MAG: hypothetical protein JJT96_16805 [Opitutales bacterium]|nr:hypothetical protein [Opitutales bacterium]
MSQRPLKPVTVEQLLQLKKSERPEPEFWARFERELESKRLRALVQPESFAVRALRWVRRAAYVAVPLTATAAMVFTLRGTDLLPAGDGAAFPQTVAVGALAESVVLAAHSPAVDSSFSFENPTFAVSRLDDASSVSSARAQFVVDALSSISARATYEKVLYSPVLSLPSRDGAFHYVAEPISDGAGGRVQSASLRLSHF